MHCFELCAAPAEPSLGHDEAVEVEGIIRAGDDYVIASEVLPARLASVQSSCPYPCGACTRSRRCRGQPLPACLSCCALRYLADCIFSGSLACRNQLCPVREVHKSRCNPSEDELSTLWNAIEAYTARRPGRSVKQAHFMLSRTSICPILLAFSRSLGKFFSRESFFLSPSKPAVLYLE